MAKICINCGVENEESSAFCAKCGSSLQANAPEPAPETNEAAPEVATEGTPESTPEKPKSKFDEILDKLKIKKRDVMLLGGVAIAAVILIIALSIIFPGPKAVVRKCLNGIENGNAKAIVNCMPSYLWDNDREEKEDAIDSMQDMLDELDIESLKYEIKRVKKYDKDDVEDWRDDNDILEEWYDELDVEDITAIREVKVKVTAKVDGERNSDTIEVILIKYKGQWKIYNLNGLL